MRTVIWLMALTTILLIVLALQPDPDLPSDPHAMLLAKSTRGERAAQLRVDAQVD
jgi:hypothetical protein